MTRLQRGVAQPGRAPALGAGSRQFESGRPDSFCFSEVSVLRTASNISHGFRSKCEGMLFFGYSTYPHLRSLRQEFGRWFQRSSGLWQLYSHSGAANAEPRGPRLARGDHVAIRGKDFQVVQQELMTEKFRFERVDTQLTRQLARVRPLVRPERPGCRRLLKMPQAITTRERRISRPRRTQ